MGVCPRTKGKKHDLGSSAAWRDPRSEDTLFSYYYIRAIALSHLKGQNSCQCTLFIETKPFTPKYSISKVILKQGNFGYLEDSLTIQYFRFIHRSAISSE